MKILLVTILVVLFVIGLIYYFLTRQPASEHMAIVPEWPTFQKVRSLTEFDAGYYNNRAVELLMQTNKDSEILNNEPSEEILAAFDKALELDSKNAIIHYNKGQLLFLLNRCEEATIALAKYNRNLIIHNTPTEVTTVDSDDSLELFIDNFYLNKNITHIPSSIHFLDKRNSPNISSIENEVIGFFSEIFSQYQQHIPEWLVEIEKVENPNFKNFLWSALWFSRTTEGEAYLKKKLNTLSGMEKDNLQNLMSGKSPDLKLLTPNSPYENDMAWGAFFASGDTVYVINLINAAAKFNDRDDISVFTAASTAKWSLASAAQRHPIVTDTLLSEYENHSGTEKGEIIYDIIEKSTDPNGSTLILEEMSIIIEQQRKKGKWNL